MTLIARWKIPKIKVHLNFFISMPKNGQLEFSTDSSSDMQSPMLHHLLQIKFRILINNFQKSGMKHMDKK